MTDGSDLAWLGLERRGDGRWSYELTPPLARTDGRPYGGTGIAVTVAAMEAETARDAVWTTVQFAGTSLDNALRFDRFSPTEWILLDFDPWFATGGYLHGGARVWAEDGTLLGFPSQTASAMTWEDGVPPWVTERGAHAPSS